MRILTSGGLLAARTDGPAAATVAALGMRAELAVATVAALGMRPELAAGRHTPRRRARTSGALARASLMMPATLAMSSSDTEDPLGSDITREANASVSGKSRPAWGKYDLYGSMRWTPG